MFEQLTNESSYASILETSIEINRKKINKMKANIDLNEILGLLSKSYSIDDNRKYINEILTLVNSYDIHILILQPLLMNILYGCYFNKIDNIISFIKVDLEMLFSSYYNMLDEVDKEFKLAEDFIGYNSLSKMDDKELKPMINYLLESSYVSDEITLEDNILKLNLMIIQIERIVHDDMNILFDSLEIPEHIDNKLIYDLELFNKLKKYYDKFVVLTYNRIKLINPIYKNIEIDVLKLIDKNLVYYWLDYISKINAKKLNK